MRGYVDMLDKTKYTVRSSWEGYVQIQQNLLNLEG